MSAGAIVETQPTSSGRADAHPVRRILLIVAWIVVAGALASLFGWDLRGRFGDLWDTITTISIEYIVAAVIAGTVKTTATAYAGTGSCAMPTLARSGSRWSGPPMPCASR